MNERSTRDTDGASYDGGTEEQGAGPGGDLPTRERLIVAALDLFEQHGFHAVGIDWIIREAGVAKMTLYKHFPSKQALMVAVMERKLEAFGAWLAGELDKVPRSEPRKRLLAFFDALGAWHASPTFYGCLFLKASGEFAAYDDPVHRVAIDHKRLALDRLTALSQDVGVRNAEELAQELLVLAEGATALAQVVGGDQAAKRARAAAVRLLDLTLSQ